MVSPADWKLRTCLRFAGLVSALQVMLVLLGLAGIHIPILNQVTGFIFVAFVPGLLLLRILKVHSINPVEAVAYTIGLSLACTMLCGALANFILPLVRIAHPITPLPLVLSLTILYMILMAAAWKREGHIQPTAPTQKFSLSPLTTALLTLLILLVLLGVQVLDKTGSNAVLIIFLLFTALCFGLGASRLGLSESAYPAVIYVISLALLYQSTLLSPYPVGTDIYSEYRFYRLVEQAGVWDYTLPGTINSCLSIVVSIPLLSQIMQLDGVWVLKAVYPLVFSLVPLVIYRIVRIQAGSVTAFLAAFFFMSVPTFSLELVSLGRQQFAELFFTLIILLLTERRINGLSKSIMLVIFGLGVSISHYTLGFINLAYMGAVVILIVILRSRIFISYWEKLTKSTGGLPPSLRSTGLDALTVKSLTLSFLIILALSFVWYALVASGTNLDFFVGTLAILMEKIGINLEGMIALKGDVARYLFAGQSDILITAALGLDFSQASLPGKIFRIIQYLTQLLIVAGGVRLVVKPSGLNFRREHLAFSLVSALILAGCIVLPWFSNILNVTRWYHITLITLCPFLVIGARSLWEVGRWLGSRLKSVTLQTSLCEHYVNWLVLPILLIYFIFTSGLVFELSGKSDTNAVDTPYSFALSSNRLDLTGIFNYRDGAAARWLSQHACDNSTVYTDAHTWKIIMFEDDLQRLRAVELNSQENEFQGGYIYFSTWNIERDEMAFTNAGRPGLREHLKASEVPGLGEALERSNRIYVNGGGEIWVITGP